MEQRLPPASRGAAGPLGRVMVMGRGRRGGRGRYKLVAEDGGGPLAAHYGRHGAPAPASGSPRRRSVRRRQPRYSPPPAPETIWPVGARPVRPSSHGDPRRDGAWVWDPGRRARGGRTVAAESRRRRRWWFGDGEFAWLVGLGLMAATLGSNFLRVTSHFMDAAMCVFFSHFICLLRLLAAEWNVYAGH